MGQQQMQRQMCCIGKESEDYPEFPQPKDGAHAADLDGLRVGLSSLQQVVGDMQGEMLRLQHENGKLQRAHAEISQENSTLKETMQDQHMQMAWDKFDVLEEHYRGLEQHRHAVECGEIYLDQPDSPSPPADADEAAGSPVSFAMEARKAAAQSAPKGPKSAHAHRSHAFSKELYTPRQKLQFLNTVPPELCQPRRGGS